MHSIKQRQSSGYIGISVLALFAVAIIAGQVRGNYKRPYSFDADLPTAIELGVLTEQAEPAATGNVHPSIRKFKVAPIRIDFGVEILDITDTLAGQSTDHATLL